jgi:CheY-like chemotaxis protein/signal transduction histidine kinase
MKPRKLWDEKKYAIAFIVALVVVIGVGFRFLFSQERLVDSIAMRGHTQDVLVELEGALLAFVDLQASARRYAITGSSGYFSTPQVGVQAAEDRIKRLGDLTADNPQQQERLKALGPVMIEFFQYIQRVYDVRGSQGLEAVAKLMSPGEGEQLMDRIRRIIQEMEQEERTLLQTRERGLKQDLDSVSGTIVLWGLFGCGLMIWALRVTVRTIGELRVAVAKNRETEWVQTNLVKLGRLTQGQRDLKVLTQSILSELAPMLNVQHAAFYRILTMDGRQVLRLLSSYAFSDGISTTQQWEMGQGLVGQCAKDQRQVVVTDVPAGYIRVTSGTGEAPPANILLLPVLFEGQLLGVMELASLHPFADLGCALVTQFVDGLGIALSQVEMHVKTEEALKTSQHLAEELRAQQEELRQTNAELYRQTEALRHSQEMLAEQQVELESTNAELEEKANLLHEERKKIEVKNRTLELAQESLKERAEQLTLTSKYKSDFLANMSHELRTPLNSLLLLSRLLGENKEGNLTAKQLQYIETIHNGGNDLLNLINEILDLSRIEAGRLAIHPGRILFTELSLALERNFQPLAEHKGLAFAIECSRELPSEMFTDQQRLEQILRNLLANAFKFTSKGSITLRVGPHTDRQGLRSETLRGAEQVISFAVQDTGIGIPADKQRTVWEAFQQADGTTSRKYGGSGLGLTISREIARLLGGEIHLRSAEGQGSTFTLYLPLKYMGLASREGAPGSAVEPPEPAPRHVQPAEPPALPVSLDVAPEVSDDRYRLQPTDRTVLIIEDDTRFGQVLQDLARENGFKTLIATRGDHGLALAHEFKPKAILLDLVLPGLDGWGVLERLKSHSELRHIPVHIISVEEERQRALQEGAFAYLIKPVSKEELERAFAKIHSLIQRKVAHLLVVEDNVQDRQEIVQLLADHDARCTAVGTGAEGIAALREGQFDCLILDLCLADTSGFELLEKMHSELGLHDLPVIVYTGKTLDSLEEARLRKFVHAIVVKGPKAPARLLDETALFLHRVEHSLPAEKQRLLREVNPPDAVLLGKQVLIVDDDLRNIFATTSVLESHGMKVVFAENGREGIKRLSETAGIDVVLMDIMMPEMDGYEAMREIRKDSRFKTLPMIALTAKAMIGDREKCIAAGASDYMTKPVQMDRLLSLLRVWLHSRDARLTA